MADTTLIVGLVGVGGTLLGAGTGATIAARAALRVERRREERAERQEAAKLRAAARLVWLDLAQCDTSLLWAEKRSRWSPAKVPLPMDTWEQHRDRLAVEITDPSSWATVSDAMAVLVRIRTAMADHPPGDTTLSPGVVASVREARTLVLAAAAVLAPIGGVPSPPRTLDDEINRQLGIE